MSSETTGRAPAGEPLHGVLHQAPPTRAAGQRGEIPEPGLTEAIGVDRVPYRRPAFVAPAPRWVGVLLGFCAVILVPWIVLLGLTLPADQVSRHWVVTWVGLDVGELVALGLTAFFVLRRSTWVEISAAVAATLLVADAWFDITLSDSTGDLVRALVGAVVLELPLAALCLWTSRHAEVVSERATAFLVSRSTRQAARLRELTHVGELDGTPVLAETADVPLGDRIASG